MQGSKQAWARGGLVFAATLMLIIGVYQIFLGIAAIARDQFFVVGANYAYTIDTTTWGWIHLGIGVLVAAAGFFLFTGATLARIIAIALIVISAIANFFFLPYYPLWSLLIIGLDVFAIWAIASVRTDKDAAAMTGPATGSQADWATTGSGAGYGTAAASGAMQGDRWPAGNAATAEDELGGRHWAPDNMKEGVGQAGMGQAGADQGGPGMGESAEAARERASAAGRAATGNQPPNPPTS